MIQCVMYFEINIQILYYIISTSSIKWISFIYVIKKNISLSYIYNSRLSRTCHAYIDTLMRIYVRVFMCSISFKRIKSSEIFPILHTLMCEKITYHTIFMFISNIIIIIFLYSRIYKLFQFLKNCKYFLLNLLLLHIYE